MANINSQFNNTEVNGTLKVSGTTNLGQLFIRVGGTASNPVYHEVKYNPDSSLSVIRNSDVSSLISMDQARALFDDQAGAKVRIESLTNNSESLIVGNETLKENLRLNYAETDPGTGIYFRLRMTPSTYNENGTVFGMLYQDRGLISGEEKCGRVLFNTVDYKDKFYITQLTIAAGKGLPITLKGTAHISTDVNTGVLNFTNASGKDITLNGTYNLITNPTGTSTTITTGSGVILYPHANTNKVTVPASKTLGQVTVNGTVSEINGNGVISATNGSLIINEHKGTLLTITDSKSTLNIGSLLSTTNISSIGSNSVTSNLNISTNFKGTLTVSDNLSTIEITRNNSTVNIGTNNEGTPYRTVSVAVNKGQVLVPNNSAGLVNVTGGEVYVTGANSLSIANTITTETIGSSGSITTLDGTGTIGTIVTTGAITSILTSGTINTFSATSNITNYSGTGTISNMIGTRTISNLGTSTNSGTINISTNTYGTINVYGGKSKDKGVSIEGHLVTVDGTGSANGTTVTTSNGDLIWATQGNSTVTGASSFTPTISKVNTASGSTERNINNITGASGTLTTSKPSSGYYYAIKSNSQTDKTITVTPNISKTGWINAGDKTPASGNIGLNDSADTYVPVSTSTVTVTGGELSIGDITGGALSTDAIEVSVSKTPTNCIFSDTDSRSGIAVQFAASTSGGTAHVSQASVTAQKTRIHESTTVGFTPGHESDVIASDARTSTKTWDDVTPVQDTQTMTPNLWGVTLGSGKMFRVANHGQLIMGSDLGTMDDVHEEMLSNDNYVIYNAPDEIKFYPYTYFNISYCIAVPDFDSNSANMWNGSSLIPSNSFSNQNETIFTTDTYTFPELPSEIINEVIEHFDNEVSFRGWKLNNELSYSTDPHQPGETIDAYDLIPSSVGTLETHMVLIWALFE